MDGTTRAAKCEIPELGSHFLVVFVVFVVVVVAVVVVVIIVVVIFIVVFVVVVNSRGNVLYVRHAYPDITNESRTVSFLFNNLRPFRKGCQWDPTGMRVRLPCDLSVPGEQKVRGVKFRGTTKRVLIEHCRCPCVFR